MIQYNIVLIIIIFLILKLYISIEYQPNYDYILYETSNHNNRPDIIYIDYSNNSTIHEFTIAIKQNNISVLENILLDISDVASPNYGNYLTQEDIGRYVSNLNATLSTLNWLKEYDVEILSTTVHGEYIICQATIEVISSMFQTTFHQFSITTYQNADNINIKSRTKRYDRSQYNNKLFNRAYKYYLPRHLLDFVHAVFDISDFPLPDMPGPMITEISNDFNNNYLEISDSEKEILNNYIPDFNEKLKSTIEVVSNYPLVNVVPEVASSQIVTPSNLRSVYGISGYGNTLASQLIYGTSSQTYLPSDITYFENKYSLPLVPVTNTISAPNNSVCKKTATISNCAEASVDLQYILAIANNVTTTYWYTTKTYVSWLITIGNQSNPQQVISISYGSYETKVSKSQLLSFNIEAMKLGLRGVTIIAASGDDGVTGFSYESTSYNMTKCGYYAMWPASSPYVTAVGGTMGGMETTATKTSEVAAQSNLGAAITTGGGFSNNYTALSFMLTAQNYYFQYVSSTILQSPYQPYVSTNRGYPDISVAACNYQIIINGKTYGVSGTSAAAPVFAGIVSLVNSYRLLNNMSTLGFLNPSIYSNNGGYTRDITSGSNQCTAVKTRCCAFGFYCSSGWDPVTGFGSINYTKFFSYYSTSIPGATDSPTYSPSLSPTFTQLPTSSPSTSPSNIATDYPTNKPSIITSNVPTISPTCTPSTYSSVTPTIIPPTITPSLTPTLSPSTVSPTSLSPTKLPSLMPTISPSISPSLFPTFSPSSRPSNLATSCPSLSLTISPSRLASKVPSYMPIPTNNQSLTPSIFPTFLPSTTPSLFPSFIPTFNPTIYPTLNPSNIPNTLPSISPSICSSIFPTVKPSNIPTLSPSVIPTNHPSLLSTINPTSSSTSSVTTSYPTINPTQYTTKCPTLSPSYVPTNIPTFKLTIIPTVPPSPSYSPTVSPTLSSTSTSSTFSSNSNYPSSSPSPNEGNRSITPTTNPSNNPSTNPSLLPSVYTSLSPSSLTPTFTPTTYPYSTNQPSVSPDISEYPSLKPILFPETLYPTNVNTSISQNSSIFNITNYPTEFPTTLPSLSPTEFPAALPSESPTSYLPSYNPTNFPTIGHKINSLNPTSNPSNTPSYKPTDHTLPTIAPTSRRPSISPTLFKSQLPTFKPTKFPLYIPTSNPSSQPNEKAAYLFSYNIIQYLNINYIQSTIFILNNNQTIGQFVNILYIIFHNISIIDIRCNSLTLTNLKTSYSSNNQQENSLIFNYTLISNLSTNNNEYIYQFDAQLQSNISNILNTTISNGYFTNLLHSTSILTNTSANIIPNVPMAQISIVILDNTPTNSNKSGRKNNNFIIYIIIGAGGFVVILLSSLLIYYFNKKIITNPNNKVESYQTTIDTSNRANNNVSQNNNDDDISLFYTNSENVTSSYVNTNRASIISNNPIDSSIDLKPNITFNIQNQKTFDKSIVLKSKRRKSSVTSMSNRYNNSSIRNSISDIEVDKEVISNIDRDANLNRRNSKLENIRRESRIGP